MGKKLFISAAIVVILFGFIFLSTVAGSALIAQVSPLQVVQDSEILPVDASQLPLSQNMNDEVQKMAWELDTIQEEVIGIRHLTPDETILRNTLTPNAFHQRVKEDWLAELTEEDLHRNALFYALLDVVEPDFDMYNFMLDLYSEQVAGFYDDESKEMVVIQGGLFGGAERMTYAHEFTHLLQDQNYDLENGLGLSDELAEENGDAYMAIQAMVEGDAVMTEYLWYQMYATDADTADVQQLSLELSTPVFDNAPWFIQNELLYPYQYGLEFLHTIYVDKGWDGVEAVYASPPVSTEQIMHPERYPDDVPMQVTLNTLQEALSGDWQILADSTFGEAYWYLTLMQQQDIAAPDVPGIWEAVKGWGGDRYQIYEDQASDQVVFVLQTSWDTDEDAKEFMDAYKTYAKLRWEQFDATTDAISSVDDIFGNVQMRRTGSQSTWIFAPDENRMNTILNALNLIQD